MRSLVIVMGLTMGLLGACTEEARKSLETFEEDPATIRIEAKSNVCWSGSIGNSTKEGCGSKTFRVKESITVANAQKDGKAGRLTMILEIKGEEVDRATTTAQYGVVTVSE